jgi:hypothetical protein
VEAFAPASPKGVAMSMPRTREQVKSDEEFAMVLWLQEAVRHNLIESWEYEPRAFELFQKQTFIEEVQMKTKSKQVERHLHQAETYTPDFYLKLTESGKKLLYGFFKASLLSSYSGACGEVWIDVKGSYNPYQNDQRYFSIVRKAFYQNCGIWVAKVIPFASAKKGLFVETFAPEAMRWMKNGKQLNRIGRSCRSIEEFMKRQH